MGGVGGGGGEDYHHDQVILNTSPPQKDSGARTMNSLNLIADESLVRSRTRAIVDTCFFHVFSHVAQNTMMSSSLRIPAKFRSEGFRNKLILPWME